MNIFKQYKNVKVQTIAYFAGICLMYCIFIQMLFGFSGSALIVFFFSQIFIVFLPGIVTVFFVLNRASYAEAISLGYAIGYGINVIEYFIIYTLHIEKWSLWILIIIAAALLAILSKTHKVSYEFEKRDDTFTIILGIYLLINVIAYSGNAISPWNGLQGLTEIPRDVQYWCSNAVSLKNGFPPNAAFFNNSTLYYHYFSSLHIGFLSRATGIDVYSLAFTLYPFGKCILYVGAINYLLNQFKIKKLKTFLMCIILFMSGKETISIVTYAWHSIENPFGCDLGLAFGIWYVGTFIILLRQEKFEPRFLMINLLMWFLCCGVKAPIASVLIFIPFFYCCFWLLKHKYVKAIGYGGAVISLFFVVNILCAGMLRMFSGTTNASGGNFSIQLYPADSKIIFSEMGRFIGIIHCVLYKSYYTNPVLFIVSSINLLILIVLTIGKLVSREILFASIVMLTVSIIGNVMGVFINAGGSSEMYFSMAAFIPAVTFNAIVIQEWAGKLDEDKLFYRKIVPVFTSVMAMYGVYLMLFASWSGGLISFLREGYNRINGIGSFGNSAYSLDEANACRWIRENSDERSVVINDRNIFKERWGNYYSGIFTERPQYIEATDLLIYVDLNDSSVSLTDEINRRIALSTSLYNNDFSVVGTLKEEGVRYVIQNAEITPDFFCNADYFELAFSSGEISVYKVI